MYQEYKINIYDLNWNLIDIFYSASKFGLMNNGDFKLITYYTNIDDKSHKGYIKILY